LKGGKQLGLMVLFSLQEFTLIYPNSNLNAIKIFTNFSVVQQAHCIAKPALSVASMLVQLQLPFFCAWWVIGLTICAVAIKINVLSSFNVT